MRSALVAALSICLSATTYHGAPLRRSERCRTKAATDTGKGNGDRQRRHAPMMGGAAVRRVGKHRRVRVVASLTLALVAGTSARQKID